MLQEQTLSSLSLTQRWRRTIVFTCIQWSPRRCSHLTKWQSQNLCSSLNTIMQREKHQIPKPSTLNFRNARGQSLGASALKGPKGSGQWYISLMRFCIFLFQVPDFIISSRKFWVLNVHSEKTCPLFLYSSPKCRHLLCEPASSALIGACNSPRKESLFF